MTLEEQRNQERLERDKRIREAQAKCNHGDAWIPTAFAWNGKATAEQCAKCGLPRTEVKTGVVCFTTNETIVIGPDGNLYSVPRDFKCELGRDYLYFAYKVICIGQPAPGSIVLDNDFRPIGVVAADDADIPYRDLLIGLIKKGEIQ